MGRLYACSQMGTGRVRALATKKEEEGRTNKNPSPRKKAKQAPLPSQYPVIIYCPSACCKSGRLIWMCQNWKRTRRSNHMICNRHYLTLTPFSSTIRAGTHCHEERDTFALLFLTPCSSHKNPRQHCFHSAGKFQRLPIWYAKVLLYTHNRYPQSGSFLYPFTQTKGPPQKKEKRIEKERKKLI